MNVKGKGHETWIPVGRKDETMEGRRESRACWVLGRSSAQPEQGCLVGVGGGGGEEDGRVSVPNQGNFILQWEPSRIWGQRRDNFRGSLELFYLGHLW